MAKLLGKQLNFGRCYVAGHQDCEVTQDIQQPMSRTREKRLFNKNIQPLEVEEITPLLSYCTECNTDVSKHISTTSCQYCGYNVCISCKSNNCYC